MAKVKLSTCQNSKISKWNFKSDSGIEKNDESMQCFDWTIYIFLLKRSKAVFHSLPHLFLAPLRAHHYHYLAIPKPMKEKFVLFVWLKGHQRLNCLNCKDSFDRLLTLLGLLTPFTQWHICPHLLLWNSTLWSFMELEWNRWDGWVIPLRLLQLLDSADMRYWANFRFATIFEWRPEFSNVHFGDFIWS